jgi:hypothetical protein
MKTLKIFLLIVVLIVSSLTLFTWYLGLFSAIEVEDKIAGGYIVAGKDFKGKYSKAGTFMLEVEKELQFAGINSTKGFGIYYDNPKTVAPEECRSFVGNILSENDYGRIDELKSKGFKLDTILAASSVVAYFPIKSNMSYIIGPIKVYPELSKYINKNEYKISESIEIYDIPNKQIEYIMQYKK